MSSRLGPAAKEEEAEGIEGEERGAEGGEGRRRRKRTERGDLSWRRRRRRRRGLCNRSKDTNREMSVKNFNETSFCQ